MATTRKRKDIVINSKEDVKLKFPKTCSRCAAFEGHWIKSQYCRLGYKTEVLPLDKSTVWVGWSTHEDLTVRLKPVGPCPKPTNRLQVLAISKVIDPHRYCRIGSPEYEEEMKGTEMANEEETLNAYVNYINPYKI